MSTPEPSRTAMAVAMIRALHTDRDPAPLIDDSWADRLLPASIREAFRDGMLSRMDPAQREAALAAPERIVEQGLRASPMYADVIIRARYTEDALASAYARGVRQYVIVGAGFDSFALRIPAAMRGLTVFEVDHHGTQGYKQERLRACGIERPAALHFVAADLAVESLASALSRSAYRPEAAALFAWLGVTMYLTHAANLEAFRNIATVCAAGSELVFSYLDQRLFTTGEGHQPMRELAARVAGFGEPWLSGFEPATLATLLRGVGHELLEDLDGEAMVQRYDPAGANRLTQDVCAHIARTRIVV